MSVPSNLVPTRINQLPTDPSPSDQGWIIYTHNGITYRVQLADVIYSGSVPSSRQVIAGEGLTGGGSLTGDVTLSIGDNAVGSSQLDDTGVTAGTYGSGTQVPVFTVDGNGRITTVSLEDVEIVGYVPITTEVVAGDGLTGGGALSDNITLNAEYTTDAPESSNTTGTAGTATTVARSDHKHPATDLANDDEVDGLLGLDNGGTGRSLVPVAGAVVWSGADGMYIGAAGNAGQVLVSQGASGYSWGTALILSDQNPNLFFAGPATGAVPGEVTFRSITNTDLPDSGVAADTYGSSTLIPIVTVNAKGVVTSVTTEGVSVTSVDWSIVENTETATPVFDNLQLGETETGTHNPAQIRWRDNASGLVEDLSEDGVSSPLVENTFKIKNTSGVVLTRGTVVYPTGATGDTPTVDKADPASITTAQPIGIVRSETINNNAVGYVTTFGKVGNFDTSAFSEGDRLYLSTTPGELTTTKPSYPNIPVRVCVVARVHPINGLIIVDSGIEHTINQDVSVGSTPTFNISNTSGKYNATTFDGAFDEVVELHTNNGFDLQTPNSNGEISWDNSARTVSISVKSGESNFYFWVDGKKYTSTSTITSVPIASDVTGIYYFYLDETMALIPVALSGVTDPVFYKYAIVALVYYNDTAAKGVFFEERHGVRMDSATHEQMHKTVGAQYAGGFSLTGLEDGETTFTGSNSGVFYDEDIEHNLAAEATHPFIYRLGTDGAWYWTAATNTVGYMDGGSDVVYNEWTGTTWQLTPSTPSTDYIIYFVVATAIITDGGTNNAVVKIIGQEGYGSRNDARDAIESERKRLITDGLPSPEICFLGAMIVRRNGDLEDLEDGSLYFDLRGTSSTGTGGDSVASNDASDISVDTSTFNDILSSTDSDTQTALETLDDHNHDGVYAPVLGSDDNYVTDAEKVVIGDTSGTNTGDQTITLTGGATGSGTGSIAVTVDGTKHNHSGGTF